MRARASSSVAGRRHVAAFNCKPLVIAGCSRAWRSAGDSARPRRRIVVRGVVRRNGRAFVGKNAAFFVANGSRNVDRFQWLDVFTEEDFDQPFCGHVHGGVFTLVQVVEKDYVVFRRLFSAVARSGWPDWHFFRDLFFSPLFARGWPGSACYSLAYRTLGSAPGQSRVWACGPCQTHRVLPTGVLPLAGAVGERAYSCCERIGLDEASGAIVQELCVQDSSCRGFVIRSYSR